MPITISRGAVAMMYASTRGQQSPHRPEGEEVSGGRRRSTCYLHTELISDFIQLSGSGGSSFAIMEFHLRHTLVFMSVLLAMHMCCMDDSWVLRKHTGWNKLILVHQWPVTVCKMAEKHCGHLPNYWTLHGLWPDKTEMCNGSWPLDLSNIQDLLAEMNKWWPDILHPNCSDFWKHEWLKHGTCAASLSCLNSQHKYFSKGLELYSSVDLNSVLEKYGIKPSKTYQLKEIRGAILNSYGIMPKIQCLPPEQSEDTQTLGQIELCFTKDFKMENCTQSEEIQGNPQIRSKSYYLPLHVCDDDMNIFYPPVELL